MTAQLSHSQYKVEQVLIPVTMSMVSQEFLPGQTQPIQQVLIPVTTQDTTEVTTHFRVEPCIR